MFGTKQFKKQKQKKFTSDNDRKRYFAIKSYYEKKKEAETKKIYEIKKK